MCRPKNDTNIQICYVLRSEQRAKTDSCKRYVGWVFDGSYAICCIPELCITCLPCQYGVRNMNLQTGLLRLPIIVFIHFFRRQPISCNNFEKGKNPNRLWCTETFGALGPSTSKRRSSDLRDTDNLGVNSMCRSVKTTVRAPKALLLAYFALRATMAVDAFWVITIRSIMTRGHTSNSL